MFYFHKRIFLSGILCLRYILRLFMKNSKYVPVSQLAMFYSDRGKFIKHKGRALDVKAAKRGTKAHEKKGKATFGSRLVMILIVGVLCYLLFSI